jgi:hypothetical protein
MKEDSLGNPHAFWDENRKRYELQWGTYITYGTQEDVMAMLHEIYRLINSSADLRNHINDIQKVVNKAVGRAILP